MKRSQWTLPAGQRANALSSLWVFPLFFGARNRIDLLNDKALDSLFAIVSAYTPESPDNDATQAKRLKQSYEYLGHATAQNLISLYIAEQFGRAQGVYHIPFASYLAAHPIPMPTGADHAKEIARSLYDLHNPWRIYAYDGGITTHCSGLNAEMGEWSSLPDKKGIAWRRYPLSQAGNFGDYSKPCLEQVKVIAAK